LPQGSAECTKAVSAKPGQYPGEFEYDPASQILRIGAGEFRPVAPQIMDFEVSGFRVVASWLGYRMKSHQGRQYSPLDKVHPEAWTAKFTTELLHLLWIIETTLDGYPKQRQLLEQVIGGPVFLDSELPSVVEAARKAPAGGFSDQGEFEY
jgi:hypothetical protein